MAGKKKKKSDKKNGKKFYEVFEVERKGKEKTIVIEGSEKEEKTSKGQIKKENNMNIALKQLIITRNS